MNVAMATNFKSKIGEIGNNPLFIVLAFRNGLQYRSTNFKILNGMNLFALCRNWVRSNNPRDYDQTITGTTIFQTIYNILQMLVLLFPQKFFSKCYGF